MPRAHDRSRRLQRLRSRLGRLKLDAILITDGTNVRYMSGFTGDSSALLITPGDAVFLTDFRYVEQAAAECAGYEIVERRKGMAEAVARQARRLGVARLGVESGAMTLESADRLRSVLKAAELVPTSGVVENIRAVKDAAEVEAIRSCIAAAEKCFEHAKKFLVPGIRELDVAAEMEYFVRTLGFDGMAFPPIVAFGPRGSLPHARATDCRMRSGDAVLLDWGVAGAGYVSDLTRVLFHHKISPRFRRLYAVALAAQQRAIRGIRPGVSAKAVDAAARKHIERAGLGRRFGHGLGHGIGMQVHEGPTIGPLSSAVLKRGMVFTVEPGIYIPGFGGVRIEDDVLVTARGVEVLSHTPKRIEDVIIGG